MVRREGYSGRKEGEGDEEVRKDVKSKGAMTRGIKIGRAFDIGLQALRLDSTCDIPFVFDDLDKLEVRGLDWAGPDDGFACWWIPSKVEHRGAGRQDRHTLFRRHGYQLDIPMN